MGAAAANIVPTSLISSSTLRCYKCGKISGHQVHQQSMASQRLRISMYLVFYLLAQYVQRLYALCATDPMIYIFDTKERKKR